jgi:dihydroorotase
VTAAQKTEISLRRPDDWHLHVRDGESLKAVIGFTAERFGRAIIMPNLKPPVTTTDLAAAYRKRIVESLPQATTRGARFEPLMTLYLTDNTDPSEVNRAKTSGFIHGFKLYPAGATTNSDSGVTRIENIYGVLERMSELGVVLQVHGEVTHNDVDVFDREARFIDEARMPIADRVPKLKIVFVQHTTKQAVQFVQSARPGIGATLTPQHLLHNRNAIFSGGIRPHYYCLPVLKTEPDRVALIEAATSGDPRFFLGTDSAPHARHTKEAACGCAGMFSAHAGIELYAEAFEAAGALARLESFASDFGPDFYGLPRNTGRIKLIRDPWAVPVHYPYGTDELVPMCAGEHIAWRLAR